MTKDHVMWDELAAGHVLRALEPEDEQRFLFHLRGCAQCERSLREMNGVAAQLAYAAEPASPPPQLERSIMDAIGRDSRPLERAVPRQARDLRDDLDDDVVVPIRRRRPTWSTFAAAASLVGLVALGVWNADLRNNVAVKDQAIARLEQVERLAADPATVRVPMTSNVGAAATAYIRGNDGIVLVNGLPANGADSIYVLWFQDESGKFHAAKGFDVVEPGRVNVVDATFDRPVSLIRAVAISREKGRALPADPSFALVHGETRQA